MNRQLLVKSFLTLCHCFHCGRIELEHHHAVLQNLWSNSSDSVTSFGVEIWEEYLEFADLPEFQRSIREKTMGRTITALGAEGIEAMLEEVRAAHEEDPHFEAFKGVVTKTLARVKDIEERAAAKDAASQGASSLEKSKARLAQKAKWAKILEGKEKCKTGVTIKFVKAATLDESIAKGFVTKYEMKDTVFAFDMDGTLVDMRDFHPMETMQTLRYFDASEKVVVTAADNRETVESNGKRRGGCEAVTTSLIAPLEDGESVMLATDGTQCDQLVQGATWDMEDQRCTCPPSFFVNGLSDVCRDKKTSERNAAIDPKLIEANGAKCYCEPDLFKAFAIDADALCPDLTTSTSAHMIAKNGVIMSRYAKAEGLIAYNRDPTLGHGRQFKQVVFIDDYVENPVNFAETMCFTEAPPGVEKVVSVWYATDRMEEREKEKIKSAKAGKVAASTAEGNYFNPAPDMDARMAAMRTMFGVN